MRRRTTLYAAVYGDGTPLINVWEWDRDRLDVRVSAHRANGEASPDERIVRMTVAFYDRLLAKHVLPARREVRP